MIVVVVVFVLTYLCCHLQFPCACMGKKNMIRDRYNDTMIGIIRIIDIFLGMFWSNNVLLYNIMGIGTIFNSQ
jgi:hypothetical protein